MLQKDKEEAEQVKLARILEEEKAQFAVCTYASECSFVIWIFLPYPFFITYDLMV